MAIDEDTRATIVRLQRAEGWSAGALARHCGVHHSAVTGALRGAGQFIATKDDIDQMTVSPILIE